MPSSFIQNINIAFTHSEISKSNPYALYLNDRSAPPDISISVSGTLSSYNLVVLLSAICNELGVNYFWSGPSGFLGTEQNVFVTEPGIYTVTVTNFFKGSRNKASVTVEEETESSTKVTTSSLSESFAS